jgi:hypothetical protein
VSIARIISSPQRDMAPGRSLSRELAKKLWTQKGAFLRFQFQFRGVPGVHMPVFPIARPIWLLSFHAGLTPKCEGMTHRKLLVCFTA